MFHHSEMHETGTIELLLKATWLAVHRKARLESSKHFVFRERKCQNETDNKAQHPALNNNNINNNNNNEYNDINSNHNNQNLLIIVSKA